jgi:uncharacterized paraquat-inducible protein A
MLSMTTPKPLAEFEQEKEATIRAIATRWQPLADEIVHLELERFILAIRLKNLYGRLPAQWKQVARGSYQESVSCPSCTSGSSEEVSVIDAQGRTSSMRPTCPECGNMGDSQWRDRLGISQAVRPFTI